MKLLNHWINKRALAPRSRKPRRSAAPLSDEDGHLGCGWFDSSLELKRGLQVMETALLVTQSTSRAGPGPCNCA